MIEVKEVCTRRQKKDFLDFPVNLYKGNPYYVPALYLDEKKIFSKDYVYYETCEAVYYIAYKDGVPAGRISGIIQKASNAKTGEKRVRFTRFDVIDDFEVAEALFKAVEKWAVSNGMDTVCGPLGFSDFEREGMLIDGFDQMSTFEEQYNAPYYGGFMDRLGYEKEVDWVESQIRLPKDEESIKEMEKMSDFVMKRYHLHFGQAKSTNDFLNRYADSFFDIIDNAYEKVYGVVPFTERLKKMMIDNFKLILNCNYIALILDEEDKPVAVGLCFPSIAKAMQISGGHLYPRALVKALQSIRNPEIIDLGLIGVEPEYLNRGISVVIANELARMLKNPRIKYADTNLNIEDNYAIINLWKRFDEKRNKRRRSYIKKLK